MTPFCVNLLPLFPILENTACHLHEAPPPPTPCALQDLPSRGFATRCRPPGLPMVPPRPRPGTLMATTGTEWRNAPPLSPTPACRDGSRKHKHLQGVQSCNGRVNAVADFAGLCFLLMAFGVQSSGLEILCAVIVGAVMHSLSMSHLFGLFNRLCQIIGQKIFSCVKQDLYKMITSGSNGRSKSRNVSSKAKADTKGDFSLVQLNNDTSIKRGSHTQS